MDGKIHVCIVHFVPINPLVFFPSFTQCFFLRQVPQSYQSFDAAAVCVCVHARACVRERLRESEEGERERDMERLRVMV